MRVTVSSTVHPARSTWPHSALGLLDRAAVLLLLLSVGTMVSVVCAQVVLRYGFNGSLDWADEVSRLAFVWSIFLAVPLGVRQGAHIGIDVLIGRWSVSAQRRCRRCASAVSGVMMMAIAWAAVGVAVEQWDELMSTLDWSVGWFIVPVCASAGLSALHLLRSAIEGPPESVAGSAE